MAVSGAFRGASKTFIKVDTNAGKMLVCSTCKTPFRGSPRNQPWLRQETNNRSADQATNTVSNGWKIQSDRKESFPR